MRMQSSRRFCFEKSGEFAMTTRSIPFNVLNDGTVVYQSACRMCHGGCGVLVYVKNDKVIRVTGDRTSPLNKGRLCVKGLASLEHLYNPHRLKYPLKRSGKRGEGKWQRISWDDALDTIAERIQTFRDESGIESVAIGQGTGRHHVTHTIRFANAIGISNWCEPGGAQCFIPRINAGIMAYGDYPIVDYYGDINPACLLVWGHNPIVSGPDGEIQFRVRDCLAKGAKMIVIDPRKTETARKADIWLQIRPGTDDALALAFINVLINETLYDRPFVEQWTSGFDDLAERVRENTPEWAEKITSIPAELIRKAARMFAAISPAALEWGVGLEHSPNCIQTVRAVSLLPALTGNIDVPGGWILGNHALLRTPSRPVTEDKAKLRLGADRFKALSGPMAIMPEAHGPSVFKAMRTGQPYRVRAFLIFGDNALLSYANSRRVYDSLMKLDFLSVMDIYMTPTAELADIVLPAATWLEVDSLVGMPLIAEPFALVQQRVVSFYEARQDEEVFIDLCRRLGLPEGDETMEEIYDVQLAPAGITFEALRRKGFISAPIRYRKYLESGFATPSGKVELRSGMLEAQGYDALPFYQEPPESPFSATKIAKEYPYTLITGGRCQEFFLTEFRQIEALRQRHPDPIVQLHPDTAAEHHIHDGQWIWIETRRGSITQKAKLTDDIDPSVIHVEHGWWFPEIDDPEHGVWRANANVLTSDDEPYDPALGTYQLRALLCRIAPNSRFSGSGTL